MVLDRLELAPGVPDARRVDAYLRRVLKREARRVEWGAGARSRITYRFYLEELETRVEAGVLRIECTALGRLPNGKSARSRLVYGGDPQQPRAVTERVLEIVARGVLSRLANLERARRTRS